MVTRDLRWLALLGAFGILGWFLKQPMFFGLFGLFVFLPLFWHDERMEAIFWRAASVAFVVGIITYTGTFVYLGILLGPGSRNVDNFDRGEIMRNLVMVWAITYSLILISFNAAHTYFEHKGN